MFSGISVDIQETVSGYTVRRITRNGKTVQAEDTFTVTCLAIPTHMDAYPADAGIAFEQDDAFVGTTWKEYVSDGKAVLAAPENYITLR